MDMDRLEFRSKAFAPMVGHNPIAVALINQLIKSELALDGDAATSSLFGPFCQLKGVIVVEDLTRGLRIVERIFADIGFASVIELAWLDVPARTWRRHPYGDAAVFNDDFGRALENLPPQITAWWKRAKYLNQE